MTELEQLKWKVKQIERSMDIFSETIKEDMIRTYDFRPLYLDELGRMQKKITGGVVGLITILLALGGLTIIELDLALSYVIVFGLFALGGFFYYEYKMSKVEQVLVRIEDDWGSTMSNLRTLRSYFSKFVYDIEKITPTQLDVFRIFFECLVGCVRLPLIESYELVLKGKFDSPQKNSFLNDIEIIRSIANEYYPYYKKVKMMLDQDKTVTSILHLLKPYETFKLPS